MKYTVKDLRVDFPDDQACLTWLVEHLYPNGITCKVCQQVTKHHKIKKRRAYACDRCGHAVYPTAGTIFHRTRIPLTDWFYAMYLMATNKAGTPAIQIQRELGISYQAAWRMMHQIRKLMAAPEGLLTGEVEMDETYIHANTFKRSSARKRYGFDARRTGEIVFGMVQRGGIVKVWHVKTAGTRVLVPLVANNVKYGSVVHTDGWTAYRTLPKYGYEHRWTEHGAGEYFTPDSSTQNIEAFWSNFKRGIRVFKHIGKKFVQVYADEFAWRYSNRHRANMFWALMCRIVR